MSSIPNSHTPSFSISNSLIPYSSVDKQKRGTKKWEIFEIKKIVGRNYDFWLSILEKKVENFSIHLTDNYGSRHNHATRLFSN